MPGHFGTINIWFNCKHTKLQDKGVDQLKKNQSLIKKSLNCSNFKIFKRLQGHDWCINTLPIPVSLGYMITRSLYSVCSHKQITSHDRLTETSAMQQ